MNKTFTNLLAYSWVWQILVNHNRLKIIDYLSKQRSRWTDMLFDTRLNPRTLSTHLKFLIDHRIVVKRDKHYCLTSLGEKLSHFNFIDFDKLKKDLAI